MNIYSLMTEKDDAKYDFDVKIKKSTSCIHCKLKIDNDTIKLIMA